MTKHKDSGVICSDGMCPYVPCKNCPNCIHFKIATCKKIKGYTEAKK